MKEPASKTSPSADPSRLGATLRIERGVPVGVDFAVFSQHGARAFVCLFDEADPTRERARFELAGRDAHVFHGFVPGIAEGALYGFRVEGPYAPRDGHRFNANKLLVDPYARALVGRVDWSAPIYGFPHGHPEEDLAFDARDDAAAVPKAAVCAGAFDWGADRHPDVPWSETVLYELHVKGFTKRHPAVPQALRGTYAGLGHPVVVDHLRRLGVTAIELLPVHAAVDEHHLWRRDLVNYWGYNTLGFFAPDPRLAAAREPAGVIREFKEMVAALHAGGIEVILDVVYNHTAEGDHLGPTLSFKGLDNLSYYQLDPDDQRRYINVTGTGNAVAVSSSPYALKLVLDSLRHWVTEMHVDGFRFDLATTLARCGRRHGFARDAAFLQAVHQDPVLCRRKLIAEPWDIFAPDSYQLGHFPVLFSEWNGEFRDNVRRFLRGDGGHAIGMSVALNGTPHRFEMNGRGPRASVNFVTCHDGFTLRDLVSYERKHNEANGENNQDGWNDNASMSFGVEGATDDPEILRARERQVRALLAVLLLSRGVPMLLAGDERGRSQGGNNNAYCQDNEISWLDWSEDERATRLFEYVSALIALRRRLPAITAGGHPHAETGEIEWLRPDGAPLGGWEHHETRTLGLLIHDVGATVGASQAPAAGRPALLLVSGAAEEVAFVLPPAPSGARGWQVVLDSARGGHDGAPLAPPQLWLPAGSAFPLFARSVALFLPA